MRAQYIKQLVEALLGEGLGKKLLIGGALGGGAALGIRAAGSWTTKQAKGGAEAQGRRAGTFTDIEKQGVMKDGETTDDDDES